MTPRHRDAAGEGASAPVGATASVAREPHQARVTPPAPADARRVACLALLLCTATFPIALPIASPAAAQDAARSGATTASRASVRSTLTGASATGAPPRAGDDAGLDLRGGLGAGGSQPVAAGKRVTPQRRARSATQRITRPPLRPEPARTLFPVVQTPVAGVPDAADPVPLKKRRLTPDDPYAPLGVRVGNIQFFPALQQGVGYDTNPDQVSPGRKPSAVLRTDAELGFRSDWSVHELSGELRGGYSDFTDNRSANRPDGAGAVRLRLDADRDLKFDTEAHYLVTSQRAGSPDLNAAVRERPLVLAYGGLAGVTQNFNRFQIRLQAQVDRQEFENATLVGGSVLRQDDRNANQYGLRLRTGYELTPGLMPFVDTLIDTRVHDFTVDQAGYRRDSDGIAIKAGTTFELSRLVTGEIAGGILHREYADRRLRDLNGPVIDAAVVWAATPLTTLRASAGTSVTETDVAGASGILSQRGTLELTHDLRRNLRLSLLGSLYTNDYQGVRIVEHGASASARLEYRLNRWLALRGSYTHETLRSTAAGSSYSANVYLVGLRVNP